MLRPLPLAVLACAFGGSCIEPTLACLIEDDCPAALSCIDAICLAAPAEGEGEGAGEGEDEGEGDEGEGEGDEGEGEGEGGEGEGERVWWDTAFPVRHRVSVVNAGSLVSDVPVAIEFASALFDAGQLGDTACIVDDDQLTVLPFEVEGIGASTALWTRVPVVNAGADEFWVYVGGPPGSCPSAPADVWRDLYAGVWHLDDTSDSLGLNPLDDSNTTADVGAVGRGRRTGSGAFLDVTAPIGLAFAGDLTVEAWFAPDALGLEAFDNPLVRYGGDTKGSLDNILYQLSIEDGPNHACLWESGEGVNHATRSSTYELTFSALHHFAWTRVAGGVNVFYLDGVNVGTKTDVALADGGAAAILRFGGNPGNTNHSADGVLDEVRISHDVKPPEWLDFQVRTMRDELATLGLAESL